MLGIEDDSLTLRLLTDGSLIFAAPLDQLRIGTVRYWHLTLLANDRASVRIMFSDPLAMTAAGTRSIALNGVARSINASEGGHPGHRWLRSLASTSGASLDPGMVDPAQRTSNEIQIWFAAAVVGFFATVGLLVFEALTLKLGRGSHSAAQLATLMFVAVWILLTVGVQRLIRGWARRQLERPATR